MSISTSIENQKNTKYLLAGTALPSPLSIEHLSASPILTSGCPFGNFSVTSEATD
jgi:hypothetical protein